MDFDYLKGKTDKDLNNFISTLHTSNKVFIKDMVEGVPVGDGCPFFEITLENEYGQQATDRTYHREKDGKHNIYSSAFLKALTICFQGNVLDKIMQMKRDKTPFWIFAGYDISEKKDSAKKKGADPYWSNISISEVWTKEPKSEVIEELTKKNTAKKDADIKSIMAKNGFNSGLSDAMGSHDDLDDDDGEDLF